MNDGWGISYEIALWWMTLDLTDDKSTLIQVMDWCHQATSHYLSQCWPRSMSPNGVTKPQWLNLLKRRFSDHAFMPHCTFSPHLLAQQGVRRAPEGEGALAGGILCSFANIGPRNSILLLIRYAMCWKCQYSIMSVSKSTQVFSKFYFRDTPEQDQGALRRTGSKWPN